MDKEKLVELAERCETATGPSIGLDDEIAKAVSGPDGNYCSRSYTASLDAAMMLVPKGWGFAIGEYVTPRRRPFARTFPPDFANSPLEHQEGDNCATAALALCAAALRSHAQPK